MVVLNDALKLFAALYQRMRAGLAARQLTFGPAGWHFSADEGVLGRIETDPELEPDVPRIVIDGLGLSWDEFGRMLTSFEGWRFELRILDSIEEVEPDDGGDDPSRT